MATTDLPASIEIDNGGDAVRVTIRGNVTDQSDLSRLAVVRAPRVILDVAQLNRFNSGGIVVWMEAIRALCSASRRVVIENATYAFMQPYAMIRGFAAEAQIESVLATYHCDRCDEPRIVTLDRAAHFPNGKLPLAHNPECSTCGGLMPPDDPMFEMSLPL
jgi:hypothetical protein